VDIKGWIWIMIKQYLCPLAVIVSLLITKIFAAQVISLGLLFI
jgi:hypothetical protein